MIKQILLFTLSVLLVASCGQKQDSATQTADTASVKDDVEMQNGVDYGFYKAHILENGAVEVVFDEDKCHKLAEANSMPCRIGQSALVEGLGKEKATALYALNLGNDVSPFLAIVTNKGHLAILSIMDAISTGDLMCSGPLEGYEDIASVEEVTADDDVMAFAVSSNGEKLPIEEFIHSGYFVLDDFEIHLTSDWNVTMDSQSADYHKRGLFYINHMNDADGPGSFSRYIIANFSDGSSCFFYLSHDDEDFESYYIRFVDGSTPLVANEDLKFLRSAYSKLFD